MKGGTSPEVLKARESRGEPRVGRVRGSGPCRGVIERPGGSRHDRIPLDFSDCLEIPDMFGALDLMRSPPRHSMTTRLGFLDS